MRRWLLRAALVAVPLVAVAGWARPQAGAIESLETIGRILRQQPAWTATYHQVFLPAGMTLGEEAIGTVWLAWPDRALFWTGDPPVRKMGLEDRRIRLVDLAMPSCDDHVLDDAEWARIPLAAVLDPGTAVDRFTVIGRPGGGFSLMPRDPGGVARVDVELGSDQLPRQVVVVDPQGSTNTLEFEDWRPTEPPLEHGWLPEPPTGVECIED
jgi:hypothetical protein